MKTQLALFTVLALIGSSYASAALSRSMNLTVKGAKNTDAAAAKISYLEACDAVANEINSSNLNAFISSVQCSDGVAIESPATVKFEGYMQVNFLRPMRVTQQTLATGFTSGEAQAHNIFEKLCQNWKNAVPAARKDKVVYESCGAENLDTFYVKPQITSDAVRVEKARTNFRGDEYCKCRVRTVEQTYPSPYGPVTTYKHFYDLMVLLDAGYYEKRDTFESTEECHDAFTRTSECYED